MELDRRTGHQSVHRVVRLHLVGTVLVRRPEKPTQGDNDAEKQNSSEQKACLPVDVIRHSALVLPTRALRKSKAAEVMAASPLNHTPEGLRCLATILRGYQP